MEAIEYGYASESHKDWGAASDLIHLACTKAVFLERSSANRFLQVAKEKFKNANYNVRLTHDPWPEMDEESKKGVNFPEKLNIYSFVFWRKVVSGLDEVLKYSIIGFIIYMIYFYIIPSEWK